MIYYSKKDAWLVAVIMAGILVPGVIGLFLFFVTDGNLMAGALPLLAVLIVVLVLLLRD